MKEFIYKILDLLTLKKGFNIHVSGFRLRFPARYFKYFEPDYELNNINFINNNIKPGMVAIDVGAHLGLISIIIGKRVSPNGNVFSFEPTPSTFRLLKRTIEINKMSGTVKPLNKAISERTGKDFFYVTDIEASNSNSLSNNKRTIGTETKIEVQLTSIDDFAKEYNLNKIDLIKIDAEGTEYSVLKGATEVIDKSKPKIILALHPDSIKNFGDTLSDIWDFVTAKKYTIIYNTERITKDEFVSRTDLFDVFLV